MKHSLHLMPGLCFLFFSLAPRAQSLKEEADSIRISRGVPGMAFAVFSPDSVIEEDVIGFRRFGSTDKIRPGDHFHIGINTTAFTVYIAARLVESGQLAWNTPLLSLFPEFRRKCAPVYRTITLQDLLGSRTRVLPFMDPKEWEKLTEPAGTSIIARRKAFTLRMLAQPPAHYDYVHPKIVFSLAGYVMAAAMMEQVTGKAWEELLTRYIRKPLKISLQYNWPFLSDSTAPAGHWSDGGRFRAVGKAGAPHISPVLCPARDISISLNDYVRFLQENLSALTGGRAHLRQSTAEFLCFGFPDYALGWNNGVLNDQSYAFHEGLSQLFSCRAEMIREKKRGIVVLANSGDADGRAAVLWVSRALERRYY